MINPTQHEKILAIAKAMYGETRVEEDISIFCKKHSNSSQYSEFNPYFYAEDSQIVQEFFKLECHYIDDASNWFSSYRLEEQAPCTFNKDLKTAIADCAYEVVKEK